MTVAKKTLTLTSICLVLAATPGATAAYEIDGPMQSESVQQTANYNLPTVIGICLDVLHCAGVTDDEGCRLFEVYGTDPAPSVNPVLGILVVDPDGCMATGTDALGFVGDYVDGIAKAPYSMTPVEAHGS